MGSQQWVSREMGCLGVQSHGNGGPKGWVDSELRMRVPEQRDLQGFVIMGWGLRDGDARGKEGPL